MFEKTRFNEIFSWFNWISTLFQLGSVKVFKQFLFNSFMKECSCLNASQWKFESYFLTEFSTLSEKKKFSVQHHFHNSLGKVKTVSKFLFEKWPEGNILEKKIPVIELR